MSTFQLFLELIRNDVVYAFISFFLFLTFVIVWLFIVKNVDVVCVILISIYKLNLIGLRLWLTYNIHLPGGG